MAYTATTSTRIQAKYDPAAEHETREWIRALTGVEIEEGADKILVALKDGVTLVKVVKAVYDRTPQLPEAAENYKPSIKFNTSSIAFRMMENIEIYLKACVAYGVPSTGIFPTVDLFEGRNIGNVIDSLQQLGTEAQRNNCEAPLCGSKPTTKNFRNWTEEQLRAGQGVLTSQNGTNRFASQKGMSIGSVRHVSDIRADEFNQEGQGIINLQSGTNKFASQKGMSMGSVRHVSDMMTGEMLPESNGYIGLQAGTNRCASQKGMSMGSVRHISDVKVDSTCPESNAVIGLQAGTNQFASQKGMTMGGIRNISDNKADNMTRESQGIINLQSGTNQWASQRGMTFGGVRHIADIKVDEPRKDSQGVIRLQSGTNQYATQQGLNFGKPRGINDMKVATTLSDDQLRMYYDYQYQVPMRGTYTTATIKQDEDDGWL